MKNALKTLFLVLLLAVYGYFTFFPKTKLPENLERDKIVKIVDGDTVYANSAGKIRIIGINAPEISSKERYGLEATEFAKNKLLNKEVYLEKDIQEKDQYGRKLRYIWLEIPSKINEETINYNYSALAVGSGVCRTYTFKPNVKYEKYLKKIQDNSRKNNLGMWKIDKNGTTRGNKLR